MIFAAMLAKPVVKYVSIFAAFIIIVAAAYGLGRSDGKALCEANVVIERAEWQSKVSDAQLKAQESISKIEIDFAIKEKEYQDQIAKLRAQGPITKIVKVYVPATVDTIMPKGFVELYNTTAKNEPLKDEIVNATKPTNIKLSDVAVTAGDNNYTCNNIRERLISLQKVVREFQAAQDELTE